MSASLVGSEMCIRDSSVAASKPEDPSGSWGREIQSHPRRPWATSGAMGSCLLYTSDAADDM
eukprot:5211367-Alexandrium_andersonii.AAC.1